MCLANSRMRAYAKQKDSKYPVELPVELQQYALDRNLDAVNENVRPIIGCRAVTASTESPAGQKLRLQSTPHRLLGQL